MAAYATTDDVKNYFQGYKFDINSNISTAKVQFYLNEAESIIESKLKIRVDLPITDAIDLKRLKAIHAKLAAADIDELVRSDTKFVQKDNRLVKPRDLRKQAMEALDKIISLEEALNSTIKSNVSGGDADLDLRDLSKEDIGHIGPDDGTN